MSVIEENDRWIARDLSEDFIDAEAELDIGEIKGAVSIQVDEGRHTQKWEDQIRY